MSEERIKYLVKELKIGNQMVFDEFFEFTKKQIFYNIFSIVRSYETSEDLLQDTYVKFLTNINDVDLNSSILGYLMVISRNLALDFIRKNKKEILSVEDELVIKSEDKTTLDSKMIIDLAKNILKEKEFRIFVLHLINELTFEEISSILKRPLGTVIRSYNNSIKKIRKELKL